MMKSQDILVLFKLVTQRQAAAERRQARLHVQLKPLSWDWQGWEDVEPMESLEPADEELEQVAHGSLTIRALEASLRLSKSEISQSLRRSMAVGLAMRSRSDGLPQANAKALHEFVVHGLKYVYPAKPGATVRGVPTGIDAPVLRGVLSKAGSEPLVWPDPMGKTQGQAIEPLYRSVPYAVRRDAELYSLLALTDAIRLGRPREVSVAAKHLKALLRLA